ncbi:Poly(A)-specific ribonuclease (PARN)-like domain containing 1 [Nesidiocoris tenuis]|uniref:Poly(A)-specific ribonuclease (PARN)-like domain containing 1 n=1 Tax=Nesidiocoris tenuis TaxID=355587 RepID=A0ABN7B1M8_9HEMI|nr:Poly(A)-specific ribonuclease (PARN)-like domain containing 1 [Nesidiocoris tenuis]
MVDVTAKNFEDVLPIFEHELKKCSFIAIDCEFSRLPLDDSSPNFLDSVSERYAKIRQNLDKCFPLQVGLVPFTYDRDLVEYKATVYKFNVFPTFFGPFDPNVTFKSSTVQFLSKYNFDFNKVFYHGIPFLNVSQRRLVGDMIEKGTFLDKISSVLTFDEREAVASQREAINKWLHHSSAGDCLKIETSPNAAHIKYFLHKEIRNSFRNVWTYDTDLNSAEIQVKHLADGERKSVEAQSSDSVEELVTSLSGFSRVMDALIRSKKPIVGHNLLVDVLSCYHHFYDAAPNDYKTFKNSIGDLIPTIYDTKFISHEMKKSAFRDILDNVSLQNLYQTFQNEKYGNKPTICSNSGSYDKGMLNTAHDAGWDAYMTGFCFVKMISLQNKLNRNSADRNTTNAEIMFAAAAFKNRINVARAFVPYLRLDGPDPASTRPPYLVVSHVRKSQLNIESLGKILSDFGTYDVKPLTSYAATVAAPNYSSYHDVVRRLGKMDEFNVEKYSMLKHHLLLRSVIAFGFMIPAGLTAWYCWTK